MPRTATTVTVLASAGWPRSTWSGSQGDRAYYAPDAWKGLVDESDPDAMVPIVTSPDRIILVVAGGDGRHSAWMPAWGVCRGATEVIR